MTGYKNTFLVSHEAIAKSRCSWALGLNRHLPSSSAKFSERHSFFRREIDNNEAVDSRRLTILQQALLPIPQQRIIVPHEKYWSFQTALTRGSHHGESCLDRNAMFEGNLSGLAVLFGH
jgi:hypothetical protein